MPPPVGADDAECYAGHHSGIRYEWLARDLQALGRLKSGATPAPARNYRLRTGGRDFDRGETIAAAAGLGAGQQQPRGDFEDIAVTSTTIHKA